MRRLPSWHLSLTSNNEYTTTDDSFIETERVIGRGDTKKRWGRFADMCVNVVCLFDYVCVKYSCE